MKSPLLDEVIKELQFRKGSWTRIADSIEGIEYSWLSKVASGQIPDPGIVKLELLATRLGISYTVHRAAA